MSQFQSIITFADSGPNSQVNGDRLNSHVNAATLLNGAVLDQAEKTTPVTGDFVLLGDSTLNSAGVPKKVQVGNLLIQGQRDGTQRWGGTASGTNTLVVTTSPASSGTYVAGEVIRFQTGGAANTGAVTINIDSRGAKNLYNSAPAALIAGDLPANSVVEAIYDGTQFQIVGIGAVNSHLCGEALRGDVQQYAVATGTNSISITPLDSAGGNTFTALADGMVVRFRVAVTNTGAVTLQVGALAAKSLVAPSLRALIAGNLTAGQIVTAVYDATNTRFVLTSPVFGADYTSALTALPGAAAAATLAHGLGAVPATVRAVMVCVTTTLGFAVGDEVEIANFYTGTAQAFMVRSNSTNVIITQLSATIGVASTAGTPTNLPNNAYWNLKVYASL